MPTIKKPSRSAPAAQKKHLAASAAAARMPRKAARPLLTTGTAPAELGTDMSAVKKTIDFILFVARPGDEIIGMHQFLKEHGPRTLISYQDYLLPMDNDVVRSAAQRAAQHAANFYGATASFYRDPESIFSEYTPTQGVYTPSQWSRGMIHADLTNKVVQCMHTMPVHLVYYHVDMNLPGVEALATELAQEKVGLLMQTYIQTQPWVANYTTHQCQYEDRRISDDWHYLDIHLNLRNEVNPRKGEKPVPWVLSVGTIGNPVPPDHIRDLVQNAINMPGVAPRGAEHVFTFVKSSLPIGTRLELRTPFGRFTNF